jgi:GcrA cell cycle regulator
MSWTDERIETLKKLWADGHSASQIAAELGGITRNAVIGKVHRLGLSGRAKSPSSAAPRPRKQRSASHMLRVARLSVRGTTALANAYELDDKPEPELLDNVIPLGQRRNLIELTEDTCRWPIGDPDSSDFFLLRRSDHHQPALLRLPLARRPPVRQCPPRPAAIARLRSRLIGI